MKHEIVRCNGHLGEIIHEGNSAKGESRFLPSEHKGSFSFASLKQINSKDHVVPASEYDCIQFLKDKFVWGEILNIYTVAGYTIFRYKSDQIGTVKYHPYIDYVDTYISYNNLDLAILGCIAMKYEGRGTHAVEYISKILNIE